MSAEIVAWPGQAQDVAPAVLKTLGEILAILQAIDAGEMLAALPDCELARAQHTAALRLLGLAERELASLHDQLKA